MSEKVEVKVGSGTIHIETGRLAKQADGAVTVQLGETIVVVAAVGALTPREGQEFFPLTVDYREKAAAAGRFPGGYFKREGRPTEKEILTSRMIDRPIRPLFPKGWFNEVQVQSILLSADGENDPDILSIIGASAALMVSDIPWAGPLGAVRVGRINGQFVANPTHAQLAECDLDLVYVGSENELVMFEGAANEIPEAEFIQALEFAQAACQPLIAAQKELAARVGKPKRAITVSAVPDDILAAAQALVGNRAETALLTSGKLAREDAWRAVIEEVGAKLTEQFGAEKVTAGLIKEIAYVLQKDAVRRLVLEKGKRLDGRGMDEVRPITCQVGLLPRAHGSALFSRGETQALTLTTLGTTEDSQELDGYTGGETEKQFILHYNFPNFSVGETGRISGPGRREIGHGALAERSIEPMLPLKEFPYAVRVTSEIMESNGSTSMATVCGGTLALMDAGVPLIRPVAGISVGLCTEYNAQGEIARYSLLTDILGAEDHFGDMDCKIAGTERGITGFQLDLKLKGIPLSLMAQAVEKAHGARLLILKIMADTLGEPRKELSKHAPRILTVKINPEKIGLLIGPGGKNIKRIVDESGCEINIEDDGTVQIYSNNPEGMEVARKEIESLSAEIEVGKIYRGKVVTIKEFGCFVEVFPGKDGLVHISELANFRVKKTEDIVKMGDEIWVKCLGVDEKGRVRLSRKAAMEERDRAEQDKDGAQPEAEGLKPEDRGPSPEERGPRPEERRQSAEDRGSRADDRGSRGDERRPRGEDRGRRFEDRGRRSEDRRSRSDDRGPRSDDRRSRSEERGPRTEERGPRSDDRGPRTEDRGPRSEERGPRPAAPSGSAFLVRVMAAAISADTTGAKSIEVDADDFHNASDSERATVRNICEMSGLQLILK
ncbi:MAG TPA: polyribonucleotide nucleotidyltransferase [Verrucomicrobiota bacterium]|nr:polyribonucleotide nucleotidyltransferase [Verrucomicrobiota bacterium]